MPVRLRTKAVITMKIKVKTLQSDINEGMCGEPSRCMEKVAITRALKEQLNIRDADVPSLHVRVDGGHISYNHKGYRWDADTPRLARNALIIFDQDKRLVKPHQYTFTARRGPKVVKMTPERQEQINAARERRIREGRPDKLYRDPTIHRRVVGYALDERGRGARVGQNAGT